MRFRRIMVRGRGWQFRGFGVRPGQAAIGGLSLVGGLPFAMIAKSDDLIFANRLNVIPFLLMNYYLQKRKLSHLCIHHHKHNYMLRTFLYELLEYHRRYPS